MEEQATYNRKHKYDVVIGIDPDVERSGYSVLDTRKMKMEMSVCPFPLLVEGIKNFMSTARKTMNEWRYMSRQVGKTNPTGICHRKTHGRAQPRKASM